MNRQDRFIKQVRVRTFKDVNIEELEANNFQLPKDLAVGE
jgi:hypothetical protein